MRLRSQKSHFQNLPEGTPPAKLLPKILRLLYFLVLLCVVGALCSIFIKRFLYFTGEGHVEVARVNISTTSDGVVRLLNKTTGESFVKGDVLAQIWKGQSCTEVTPNIRLIRLKYEIKQQQYEHKLILDQLYQLETNLEASQETTILRRALEIGDVSSRRKAEELMLRDLMNKQQSADKLLAEIKIKEAELALLDQEYASVKKSQCEFEDIVATFSGTIDHVTRRTSEYLKRGEPLFMVIPESDSVAVAAYIDTKNLHFLDKGKQMTIQFPDKSAGVGEITEFVSSARSQAYLVKNDYVPVSTELRVTLKPLTEQDARKWRMFDRMDVKVKGERK